MVTLSISETEPDSYRVGTQLNAESGRRRIGVNKNSFTRRELEARCFISRPETWTLKCHLPVHIKVPIKLVQARWNHHNITLPNDYIYHDMGWRVSCCSRKNFTFT
jgi:hypothetical protein